MKNRIEIKNLNKMAYPILLNYLLLCVFEILDKAIVGQYSIEGFASVGIAASLIFEITGALGILSMAFGMMAAKEVGEKNFERFENIFVISKNLALLVGLCFFVISIVGGRLFFQVLYGLKDDTLNELLSYFYPASITVLQNMLLFQYSAYYRNKLNTKISFYSTVVSTSVNLFFDVSLVYGLCGMPELGTQGAAWGSVIGLFSGCLVYQIPYYLHRKQSEGINLCEKRAIRKNILKLYPALFGQEFFENTLFVFVVAGVVSRLGVTQMAIYGLLETVVGTIGLPIFAYATATQTYALQNRAAGEKVTVRRYLMTGQVLAAVIVTLLCVIAFPWREQFLRFIISDPGIIKRTANMAGIVLVVLLAKIPYQFSMSFLQGIEEESYVFRCAVVSMILTSLGVILCGRVAGIIGVYLMMTIEYLVLGMIYWKKVTRKGI